MAGALALAMAGCAARARPAANAAPPAPLSTPQTQVALPEPQPLNPDALATVPPAGRPVAAPAASGSAARQAPPAAAQTAPAEQRPAVQAIVSAEEQKRLKDSAEARKREVRAVLARIGGRSLSASDQDLVKRIEFFLNQSDQAERSGDMSQADAFAQRAQALARGWQGGR